MAKNSSENRIHTSSSDISSTRDLEQATHHETGTDTSGRSEGLGTNHKVCLIPVELLEKILGYLDYDSLESCGLVSKKWRQSAMLETTWESIFLRRFGQTRFKRLSLRLSWKSEYLTRAKCLNTWSRGLAYNTVSFRIPTSQDGTKIFADLSNNRIFAFNATQGYGVVADPVRGRYDKFPFYTDSDRLYFNQVTQCEGSKYSVFYGMITGRVTGVLFSHEAKVRSYVDFHDNSEIEEPHSPVSKLWVNKNDSPKTAGVIGVVSGAANGSLTIYDVHQRALVSTQKLDASNATGDIRAVPLQSSPIVGICSDGKNKIVAINATGDIFFVESGTQRFVTSVVPDGDILHEGADFEAGLYLVVYKHTAYCVLLDEFQKNRTRRLSLPRGREINRICIDDTKPTNVSASFSPGRNARYVIGALFNPHTLTEEIVAWRLNDEPNIAHSDTGYIDCAYIHESPFARPRIESCSGPIITQLAANSAIFLVSSYNGRTFACDILSGYVLREVSTKFPKKVLNFRDIGDNEGLLPVSHLDMDPDVTKARGIISIGPAIQYFEIVGATGRASRKKGFKKSQPNGTYSASRSQPTSASSREALSKAIEDDVRNLREDEHFGELTSQAPYNAPSGTSDTLPLGLSEDEQIQYALQISETDSHNQTDPEILMAMQLSLQTEPMDSVPDESSDVDEELARALRLSLAYQ